VAAERLHWEVEAGGRRHPLDILPGLGRSVAVEVDGRRVARLPKPTRQRPWQQTDVRVDGEEVTVALVHHLAVMRTELFRNGVSVRDGRSIEAAAAAAPVPLTNYEAWLGEYYRPRPSGPGSRWARAWPWIVALSLVVWFVAVAGAPVPAGLRLPLAGVLLVSGRILVFAVAWWMGLVAERAHRALLDRPSLGDWRIVLWFAAFAGSGLLVVAGGAAALVVADSI